MSQPPFDVRQAHRWFAVELNNLSWSLVEQGQRSDGEVERMIHAAHGACFHWLEVGTPLHHVRAECLLTAAYAIGGLGKGAARHAERSLELGRAVGESLTPFDRAMLHGCAAKAFAAGGREPEAGEQRRLAAAAFAELTDADERDVFARVCGKP